MLFEVCGFSRRESFKAADLQRTQVRVSSSASDRFGSHGSRFPNDVFGYSKTVVPAELAHQSPRFLRPPLQVQSREKPDSPYRLESFVLADFPSTLFVTNEKLGGFLHRLDQRLGFTLM